MAIQLYKQNPMQEMEQQPLGMDLKMQVWYSIPMDQLASSSIIQSREEYDSYSH